MTSGYTSTAYFWSAQGAQLRYSGTTAIDGFDDVIINGSTDIKDPHFVAYYVKDNAVVAVVSMGADPAVSLSAELLYGISRDAHLICRGTLSTAGNFEGWPRYTTDGLAWWSCAVVLCFRVMEYSLSIKLISARLTR